MAKEFNKLVFIGRFQPFHNGHKAIVDKALELANEVVVIVGSAFQARTLRNPFTFEERKEMILNTYGSPKNLRVEGVMDRPYNDHLWIADVKNAARRNSIFTPDPQVNGLIGHRKDGTSYYLDLFPSWKNVGVDNVDGVDATSIRNTYFSLKPVYSGKILPEPTKKFLDKFYDTPEYNSLMEERRIINDYKEAWGVAPYPPTFVTADALVVQSEHVLLVERGAHPGKGLLALPGGFVNQTESVLEAALRELREETKLKVPYPVLKGSVKDYKLFDAPRRSERGRTITHAYKIDLGFGALPKVKGSDDAKKAFWMPISEIDPVDFFEDHFHIIQEMV